MANTIFLASPEFLTYDDLVGHKAIQRLRQLSSASPVQVIKRSRSATETEGYLVEKAWYAGKLASFATNIAATYAVSILEQDATYLGRNLSVMIDLINGRIQAPSQSSRAAQEGESVNGFSAFSFEDSAAFYVDDSNKIMLEPNTKREGNVLGYLLNPAHYASLNITPATGSRTGTGNGTISVQMKPGTSVAETLTFTATSATAFSVVGSESGALGTATVGTSFSSPGFVALITAGTTPFIATDAFVVESLAPAF